MQKSLTKTDGWPRWLSRLVSLRPKRITLLWAWYDLWVGAFWDRKSGKLYVLPVPCIGVVLHYGNEWERKGLKPHGKPVRISIG